MTTLNFSFHAPERPELHIAKASKPLVSGLFISVLVHIAVLLVVLIASQVKHPIKKLSSPKTAPINAVLYFPSPKKSTPKPQPMANVSLPEIAEQQPPKTQEKQEKTPASDTIEPQAAIVESTQPAEIPQEAPSERPTPENTHPIPANISPLHTESSAKNQQAGRLNLSPRSSTERYFIQREQEAIAKEGERAAREFRELKRSPRIIDPRKGEPKDTLVHRPTKKVNCSSTTNKTLAIVSTFTGGTIECTKLGEHDKFIEARISKLPPSN